MTKRKYAIQNSEFAYSKGWITKKEHLENVEYINNNEEHYYE